MAESTPLQFSLKTMLAVTAGAAMFFAAGAWFGAAGYIGFVVIAVLSAALRGGPLRMAETLSLGLIMIVAAALLAPAFYSPKCTGGRRSECANNLKAIGLALQNYNDVYKCFPPVYTTDENGKPMHSWRVLILPFIGYPDLYKKYDFNEPWNGPHNSLLAKEMPPYYRCPSDNTNPPGCTDYVAVVGPETIWQANQSTTFAGIKDVSSSTIAVIEAAGAGINWMEPSDLPFAAVGKGINPKQGQGISSHHPGAVIAVFADGHVQTIQEGISLETLKALFTKAGGEEIDEKN